MAMQDKVYLTNWCDAVILGDTEKAEQLQHKVAEILRGWV